MIATRWVTLVLLALGCWTIYLLGPVLTPFFVAAILAYLGSPVVSLLQRRGVGRSLGTTLVFLVVLLVLSGIAIALLPAIQAQSLIFLEDLKTWLGLLQTRILPQLSARLDIPLSSQALTDYARANASKLAHWLSSGLQAALVSGSGIVSWIVNLLLIPVLGFYLMRDWPKLLNRLEGLVPRPWLPLTQTLARDANDMLMAFLRGQFLVMLALGVSYALGLTVVGLKTAILIGLLSGLLSFVPYLGFISGILMASIAMYVQAGTFLPLLKVWAVYGVGSVLESMVFTPLLVGDRIGLHPVLVIFAVLAGGQLFGFVGLLLALPCTAVLIALLRHAHRWYVQSPQYGAAPEGGVDHD